MIQISKIRMNKVEFNKIQIFTNFAPEMQNKIRYRKKQEILLNTEKVETRKALLDVDQFHKKNFEIIKHDLAKTCLDYYRNLQTQINSINLWKKNWLLIIFFAIIEKYIAEFTKQKYNEKKKLLQVAFVIQNFQRKYRKNQRKTGFDQEERFKWGAKAFFSFSFKNLFILFNRGLLFHYSVGRKTIKKRYQYIIADLILNNANKLEFLESLKKYVGKGNFLFIS